MFTPEQRASLRALLLDRAAADPHIEAAAITGSASANREDRWSDIDLAFAITDAAMMQSALAEWTEFLYREHAAIHHLNVHAGAWIYRVFLLPGTLQVDLAFVPASDFRAMASTFQLIFGTAREEQSFPEQSAESLSAFGWLYALHARTSIARGHFWQAEYMISGLRDHTLALACIRCNLPSVHGRGMDRLPDDIRIRFAKVLVKEITSAELIRAFHCTLDLFLAEMQQAVPTLASRLETTIALLKQTRNVEPLAPAS